MGSVGSPACKATNRTTFSPRHEYIPFVAVELSAARGVTSPSPVQESVLLGVLCCWSEDMDAEGKNKEASMILKLLVIFLHLDS
jgi:hypothetical protein